MKKHYFRIFGFFCELTLFNFYRPFFIIGFDYNYFQISNNLFSFVIYYRDSMDFNNHLHFKFGFEKLGKMIVINLFIWRISLHYPYFFARLNSFSYVGFYPYKE